MGTLPLSAAPTSSLIPPPPALPGGLSLPSGRTAIVGILNVTPDSFSDGGRYTDATTALHHARTMVTAGAGLIDVGRELTRLNSTHTSADEEWACICTIVESLATDGVIASMDTLHVSTTRETARIGAAIISDVNGGHWNPEMNAAVAESGCTYVVQYYHTLPGVPGEYFDCRDDLMGTLVEHVGSQVHNTIDTSVTANKIVVNPGPGFSLTGDQCWQILRELPRFLQGGHPILVGASRRRFVKALDGDTDANSADIATYCAVAGAQAIRVHDVTATAAAITRRETDVN